MFNKDRFSELLIKARGDRNNKEYSEESGVSRAYISGYVNKSIENAPTPDVIRRMASVSKNDVTYEDLMIAAGHLSSDTAKVNGGNIATSSQKDASTGELPSVQGLTDEEEKDVEKRIEKLHEDLRKKSEGLMFSGEPMSPEALESVLAALEFGMKQAKLINKKYTPKK